MRRYFGLLFLALIGLPLSALAQERDRLDHRGEVLGWEGVGRLDTTMGTCTGTLIARDLVLTAAHCVVDTDTRQVLSKDAMRFRAGLAHDFTAAVRGVSRIVLSEGYLGSFDVSLTEQVRTDIALLRLDSPIFSTEAEPFRIHDRALDDSSVILVSYGRGRNTSLQRESGCRHKQTYRGGLMTFDCDVTFGSSGAPVFVNDQGRLRIVSVVSMMSTASNAEKEAIGMSLPAAVSAMMRDMRNDAARAPVSAGARRVTVGERAGGARFIKVD
ncbi:trypsin-like serine peptidase [Marivita geojedonensis]|uniref:trypsin-like serine peptidase n=1 Tax=Marivita geojedonensis TaxID=1123756 RepID=UPI000A1E5BA9|nr:trypsin-like peptidase domain-containing protein [Marivita geojedonensis]PRY74446.1 protease YdgD [Marivita geojedonensis]